MKLVSVLEMKMIEKEANRAGLPYVEMMQRAGAGLAGLIEARFPSLKTSLVIGLIGGGNNGGDTLIALIELQKTGWTTAALFVKERENDLLTGIYIEAGGKILTAGDKNFETNLPVLFDAASLVLDGIIGTGVTLPLKDEIRKFLVLIQKNLGKQTVIAVDCPSGVDCESGAAAPETLKADLTVCMEAVKIGLVRFPAYEYCGEILSIPIGLASAMTPEQSLRAVVDDNWARGKLPARPRTAHKGTFGTVMVVGGSANYVGAPMLSGLAAFRTGSGLVSLAVPQSIHAMMAGQIPEAVWLVLNDEGGVISETAAELVEAQLKKINALLIGPGIGRVDTTFRFLDAIMFSPKVGSKNRRVGFLVEETNTEKTERRLPAIVLDADGLRWLAEREGWAEKIQTNLVLTPHPGEMAALTGLTVEEIQNERMGIAALYAKKWKQVVVLKGALTVIAAPDGRLAVIPVASSALAKAGSGDVLSGMIASLIGQGMGEFEAASVAAWIHARAGLEAADQLGSEVSVLASDIIHSIANVFAELNKNTAL